MLSEHVSLQDYLSINLSYTLQPYKFFISYNGVLVLIYKQWTINSLYIKHKLNNYANLYSLNNENMGSLFPKTTIACLNNNQQLTSNELYKLYNLCQQFNNYYFNETHNTNNVLLNNISIVTMLNRSLSSIIHKTDISLIQSTNDDYYKDDTLNVDMISNQSYQYVQNVVNECNTDTLDTYIHKINTNKGQYTHYYDKHIECTCVSYIDKNAKQNIDIFYNIVSKFITEVDKLLPNKYKFFDLNTMHVTLRAIS